jgi:hypothetical protein
VQVSLVVTGHARPPGQRGRHQFIGALGGVVAAGGPGSQAKFSGDRGDVLPLGLQLLHLLIALAGAHHPGPVLGVGGGGLLGRLLRVGCLIRGSPLEDGVVVLDAAMVGGDGLLHVVTQVIPHVPPVGDLPGAGRCLAGAQRITPALSLQISSTPGCARSQSAKVPASRSGRMPVTRWVSMSTRTLA